MCPYAPPSISNFTSSFKVILSDDTVGNIMDAYESLYFKLYINPLYDMGYQH